jgi:hypothetical protein
MSLNNYSSSSSNNNNSTSTSNNSNNSRDNNNTFVRMIYLSKFHFGQNATVSYSNPKCHAVQMSPHPNVT